jgi:hypothetical protein
MTNHKKDQSRQITEPSNYRTQTEGATAVQTCSEVDAPVFVSSAWKWPQAHVIRTGY